MPTISFDFCFTSRGRTDEKLVCLVVHDKQTGYVDAIPTPAKGGPRWKSYLVGELCKFISFMGYEAVILKSDGELGYLSSAVQRARLSEGLRTVQAFTAKNDHQANGAVEQAVQSLRQQAGELFA